MKHCMTDTLPSFYGYIGVSDGVFVNAEGKAITKKGELKWTYRMRFLKRLPNRKA